MLPTSRFAFKEWAAICRAVAAGRQSILLRKGGIHERRGQFAVEHDEFWLFPTRFHQSDDELTPEGSSFLAAARKDEPPAGLIRLSEFVTVSDVVPIEREELLPALRPFHVYSDRVLTDRFHYKRPGLTVLIVRAFASPTSPHIIPDSPHFGGCRTWVDLPSDLSTASLTPVLDDQAFEQMRRAVQACLSNNAIV